jgi:flagellar motor switch protein FliM
MTDKDVLTQEEIDALLNGVDDSAEDAEGADHADSNVSHYDLTKQDKVVRGRMPTLELIAERFARMLRNDLPASLKVPIEVGLGGVQVIKYSEYIDTLYVPTCIKLIRIKPFAGTCLLTLDAKLIHRLVDLFFGGTGVASSLEGKEFTLTERRVINRIVDLVLQDFEAAWRDELPVETEVVGDEVNPGLVNVIPGSEILMLSSYRLELEEGGGELHIAFPYASLEPFKGILDTTGKKESKDGNDHWRALMERSILDAELPMNCVIGDLQLRLRDLMSLQPGDVLDLNMQEMHQVCVSNIPTFYATLGDSRGKFALEFESFSNH